VCGFIGALEDNGVNEIKKKLDRTIGKKNFTKLQNKIKCNIKKNKNI
jgi:hypothetical protein